MIPEFLRMENYVEDNSELTRVLNEYEDKFKKSVSLDWLSLSEKEWVKVLRRCIRIGKSFQEVYGEIEYEDDTDY